MADLWMSDFDGIFGWENIPEGRIRSI